MGKNESSIFLKAFCVGLRWAVLVLIFGALPDMVIYWFKGLIDEQADLLTARIIFIYCSTLFSAIYIDLYFFYKPFPTMLSVTLGGAICSAGIVIASEFLPLNGLLYYGYWALFGTFVITLILKTTLKYCEEKTAKSNELS